MSKRFHIGYLFMKTIILSVFIMIFLTVSCGIKSDFECKRGK